MSEVNSLYKEFSSFQVSKTAVRALSAAGFSTIEIENPGLDASGNTDAGVPNAGRLRSFLRAGIKFGAMGGLIVGCVVFGLTALILNHQYAYLVGGIGLGIFVIVGVVVGLEEALIYTNRITPIPVTHANRSRIGVRVWISHPSEITAAKRLLNAFSGAPAREERFQVLFA